MVVNASPSSSDPPVPEILLETLRQVARDRTVTYYIDIARLLGIDTSNEYFAVHVGRVLDQLNRYEFSERRPLLSAVVVAKETGRPGYGYFGCARDLRRYSSKDDEAMWVQELKSVYDYWSQH